MTSWPKIRAGVLITAVACVLLAATPVHSEPLPFLQFDVDGLGLAYTAGQSGQPGSLQISDTSSSSLLVSLKDGVNQPPLQWASIDGGHFDLSFALSVGTGPNYAMNGTVAITDVDKSSSAIYGAFTSTTIAFSQVMPGVYSLTIEGVMKGIDGGPLLVNRPDGAPYWVFQGEDGSEVDKTVTVDPSGPYTDGWLFQMTFGNLKGPVTLDSLFGKNQAFTGGCGFMDGTIVPAPGAVVLGLMGLVAIGLRMRRYA